jgi:predicted metal-dependent phosphoesterase TrpH
MPTGQPFTALCQTASRLIRAGRADLHVHTTASDGLYSPEQAADVARLVGLSALAITDHDSLDGIAAARAAAAPGLEIIAGVEITAEDAGREMHLLGYFVRCDEGALTAALDRLRQRRRDRFLEMAERLRLKGARVNLDQVPMTDAGRSLGRRNLAAMLCQSGQVGSIREAFDRYLHDGGPADVPKSRLPLDEAIARVRDAGGVSSLAHPPAELDFEQLAALRRRGLQAVEADYPTHRAARTRELRDWASKLGMAITGGSDCHGPQHPHRGIGCRGLTAEELDTLRNWIV